MNQPLLTVTGLGKSFTLHQQGRVLPGIRDIGFQVRSGRLTALVGPSGAGKSTVLKCIYRTYLPHSGSIVLDGHAGPVDLATCDERTALLARRHDLGFVTQFLHCLPRQETLDVVAAPLAVHGMPPGAAREAARGVLRSLDLPERLWEVPPATFSGGERQRVNLARGLVGRPRLLLLDEPTASLDRRAAELVAEAIAGVVRAGVAVLAIFHDPDLVQQLAADVVTLQQSEEAPCAV